MPFEVRPRLRASLLRRGVLVSLWVVGPIVAEMFWVGYARLGVLGMDAHAYWLAGRSGHPYGPPPGWKDAFLYSPAFAQVMHPLAQLPFVWFATVIIVVDAACFAWLLKPLGWKWVVPLMMCLSCELALGQVIGLLTVMAVLGVNGTAGSWAFGWLTKITPGVLGTAWHGARGEWRRVGLAIATSPSSRAQVRS